jgi:hypothetical protein
MEDTDFDFLCNIVGRQWCAYTERTAESKYVC